MSAIVGSFSRAMFIELMQKNQDRSNTAYAVMTFRPFGGVVCLEKEVGFFQEIMVPKEVAGDYYLGFLQTPVPGHPVRAESLQPSHSEETYLFLEGDLSPRQKDAIGEMFHTTSGADNLLMHLLLNQRGLEGLEGIEGVFSALYINRWNLYLFSTRADTPYLDQELNLGREKFGRAGMINPKTVYHLRLDRRQTSLYSRFKTRSELGQG
ncbi:MAG: hypothetical protein KQJ78_17100 [Deltaproteobacteria bacterium]|nr:hypothetical protein [Deltaproteobacteria bacterium]